MRKFSYEDVKYMFKQRDYELVSKVYINCEQQLEYICKKHSDKGIQDINMHHFRQGQGCRFCGKENKRNGRQKDLEEYNAKELTESKGMEFVAITRENSKLCVYYICPKHREYGVQKTSLESIRRMKVGCTYCIGRHKTTEIFKKEVFDINPNIKILGEYIDAKTPIECECLIDNTIWFPTPNALLCGQGCPECGRIASNVNSTKTNDVFISQLHIINPDVIPLQEYIQAKIKIWVMCKKCGHKWLASPDGLLSGNGCPNCRSSKNEKKIFDVLINLGYSITKQKKYSDCRDQLPLPFDFYIDNLNILIEYDGEQHYIPIPYGSMSLEEAKYQLQIRQKHDSIKTAYCQNNNIPLIRIPYWESKNLECFLIQQLSKIINS